MRTLFLIFALFVVSGLSFSQKADLSAGLLLYYPFEKDASDSIGTNDGEPHEASIEPEWCGTGAYYFNGSSSYIECGNDISLNGNFSGFTISVWVKPDEILTNDLSTILAKWGFDPKLDHYGIWLNSSYKVVGAVCGGYVMENGMFSNKTLSPDYWYHIVFSWRRNGQIKLYIDGKVDKVGAQTSAGINTRSKATLKVGRQIIRKNRPYRGHIGEIRLYKRTLSDGEVEALYNLGKVNCDKIYLSGVVVNKKTNEPVESEVVFEDLFEKTVFMRANTDPEGRFRVKLPRGGKYGFYAVKDGFIAENQNVETDKLQPEQELNTYLYLIPFEKGMSLRLNNIFFDTGKSNLRGESYAELNRILPFFKQYPNLVIEISGHTDSVGSDESNQKLSEDRAASVKRYLVSKGVNEERIQSVGHGENKPVDTNDTDEGRQNNRRVEFKIIEM